jgi:primary-amine oxidase
MHDHVLNWKADLDILGTKNTVGMHTIEPKTVKYVWDNSTRNTMHLVRSELKNEDNATLHWPENSHSMFLVYNKEEKNKYGEERAWRMMPHIGGAGMHATIQNSTNLGPSMNFAKAPIYVTSEFRAGGGLPAVALQS